LRRYLQARCDPEPSASTLRQASQRQHHQLLPPVPQHPPPQNPRNPDGNVLIYRAITPAETPAVNTIGTTNLGDRKRTKKMKRKGIENRDEKEFKNHRKKRRRKPLISVTFRFSVFRPKMSFRKSLPSFAGLGPFFRLPAKSMCTPLCTIFIVTFPMTFKIDFVINASFVGFYAQILGRDLFS